MMADGCKYRCIMNLDEAVIKVAQTLASLSGAKDNLSSNGFLKRWSSCTIVPLLLGAATCIVLKIASSRFIVIHCLLCTMQTDEGGHDSSESRGLD